MIRELEECERVLWLQFQWMINLVLISRAWFGEVMWTLCLHYHTQTLSHTSNGTCSSEKCMYANNLHPSMYCAVQLNLCTVHAFTHHVKFWLTMSTWFSLNRRCQGTCCPAQNISVQSELINSTAHSFQPSHSDTSLGICAAQSDRESGEDFAKKKQVSTSGESNAYQTHYCQHHRYQLLYILFSLTKPVGCLWFPSHMAIDPSLSYALLGCVANVDKLYRMSHWCETGNFCKKHKMLKLYYSSFLI